MRPDTLPQFPVSEGGNATTAPLADTTSASSGPSPIVPQAVIDHLKLREGCRTDVYLDCRHKPTAGLGHLMSATEQKRFPVGSQVPSDQLTAWADADSLRAYRAALAQASRLGVEDPDFIKVLTAVNFQLGTGWNQEFAHTWGLMVRHQWDEAATEVAKSAWASQTPVRVEDFQSALRAQVTPPSDSAATLA